MEELPVNVKIKQEKLSPAREAEQDEIEKLLDSNLFREKDDVDSKKDIEPTKTSDQLLEELFGVFGANVNIPEILNNSEKKSKKKKKRKHDGSDSESSKQKKAKKAKKVKKEKKIDNEDCKDDLRKLIIKKEKKNKEKKDAAEKEKPIKKEVTERRKLSIVIKDLRFRSEIVKPSSVFKPSTSKDKDKGKDKDNDKEREKVRGKEAEKRRRSKEKEREKDREKDRKKKDRKKSNGNVSDVSLSDEETYRKMLEYHTSAQWYNDRNAYAREWDRGKYRRARSRDDDRGPRHHQHRSRSRSRDRSRSRKHSPIDKKKLLEIARRNAISMLRSGTLPRNISENTKDKLMAKIRHGGKSIEELTNYCKKLSTAEDLGELSELSDSDNDGDGKPRAFHHPFEVKDRGPIVMNIRNSVPIAPKQASELKAIMSQFPVSSGKQHQKVENTWVPVTTAPTPIATIPTVSKQVMTLEKQIQEQLPELARPKPTPVVEPSKPLDPALTKHYDWKSDDHYLSKSIISELAPPSQPPVDVSEIISQRLNAMRKLQENPCDFNASKVLFETQLNMSQWAQSKYTPGQFLGSTDVRPLTQKELASGSQAWAHKNQLINTRPVNSGMGMHLLKKMGWTPGEGLGKEGNQGSLTPLLLELKLDKRGLEANDEVLRQKPQKQNRGGKFGPKGGNGPVPMASLESKHPVSLLGELASKRKWGAPNYTLVHEQGPAHAKNFVFKVRLNGIDYTCPSTSNNKKEAKSTVAKFCLQQLGILPS